MITELTERELLLVVQRLVRNAERRYRRNAEYGGYRRGVVALSIANVIDQPLGRTSPKSAKRLARAIVRVQAAAAV